MRNQAFKYKQKVLEEVKSGDRGCAYSALRKLGTRPGDNNPGTFTLPSHQTDELTDKQCAEKIAEYFATISQEYQPLDVKTLPRRVRLRLRTSNSPSSNHAWVRLSPIPFKRFLT